MKISSVIGLALLMISCNVYAQIHGVSFSPKSDMATGSGASAPTSLTATDLDNDGKTDLAVINTGNNTFSVFRNTGSANAISFGSEIIVNMGGSGAEIRSEDIDGDGFRDVVVSNTTANTVSVFLNTSSPGNISFASRIDYATGLSAASVILFDFDGDGKKDLAAGNMGDNTFSVFRNASSPGSLAFDTRQDFAASGTASATREMAVSDVDGDGITDLAVLYQNGYIGIFRNTSVIGTIAFATAVNINGISQNSGIAAGDLDSDGKPDLVVSHYAGAAVMVFKNNSTPGSISFATSVNYTTGTAPHYNIITDVDNDNKPEILIGNRNSASVSILRNISSQGVINSSSFASKVDFTTGAQPMNFAFTDLDGDGKRDLVSPNYLGNNISILRSQVVTGLVAHYPLNGNGNDLGPYALNGTVSSGVTASANRYLVANSSMQFDGTANARIITSNSEALSIANMRGISVSLWIRPDNVFPSPGNRIIYLFYDGTRSSEMFFNYNSKQLIVSNWTGTYSPYFITPAKTFQSNVWYHVVVTIDSLSAATQQLKVYVNDTLQHTQTVTMTKPGASSFQLSKHQVNNWNFTGGIDDVRIYNIALLPADVHNLYQADKPNTVYYSKATGNLNQLSTWGTNPDGSGTSPLSFDSSNVIYNVHNNPNPTVSGLFKINAPGSAVVLGDGTNPFNMTLTSSDTLWCDSVYVNNNITVTVQGSLITGKLGSATTSTVQYLSANAQGMASGTYNNLVISGGLKTLTGHTSIRNNFVMLASVSNPSFVFMLGTDTVNRGTLNRTSGVIYGTFSRWFDDAASSGSTGLFPIGNNTRYTPFKVDFTSAPMAGGMLTAEFVGQSPGNLGLPLFDMNGAFVFIDKAAIDGYWKITGTIATGTITAAATVNNFTGVSVFQDLRLIKRNMGGSWTTPGFHVADTGSNSSFIIGRSGISSVIGEYGVGGDKSVNPLPVRLLSFNAVLHKSGSQALLYWATASEQNNRAFVIERSADDQQYTAVGQVAGKGTTAGTSNYRYDDDITTLKKAGVKTIFYRLKQVDNNGEYTYSKSTIIQLQEQKNVELYPNPACNMLTVEGLEQPAVIYDLLGNKVITIETNGTIDIGGLGRGTYIVRSGVMTQKLIKY